MSGGGDGPWVDPAKARVGLLLEVAASVDAALLAEVPTDGVVAIVLAAGHPDAAAIRDLCRQRAVACLAHSSAEAVALGADGVHLADTSAVAAARTTLGATAIVGANGGASRDALMVAGEDGADYVMASADPDVMADLCAWWTELFVLPLAVDGRLPDLDLAGLIAAGADFALVGDAVWAAASPAEAIAALSSVIEQGRALRVKD